MKNAAEMSLADFKANNVQLLVKDDGGSPQGARNAAEQAIAEGAEIIVGPLFAQSVSAVGQVARPRNIPVIAFSTDASVAARGVYLLSFLPETDVRRIVASPRMNGAWAPRRPVLPTARFPHLETLPCPRSSRFSSPPSVSRPG